MKTVLTTIRNSDPVHKLYEGEYNHYFLCFCSLICLLRNKKLNLANIFLFLLQDKDIRDIFKRLCDIDSDYKALKKFLQYDPTLYKSKYIKNYLDAGNIIDQLQK